MNNTDMMQRVSQRLAAGERFALATVVRVVSPTAAKPGMRAMIDSDGSLQGWIGGGCARSAVVAAALDCLKHGGTALLQISPEAEPTPVAGVLAVQSHCQSRGSADVFVEAMGPRALLWVYGSTPTALALVEIAACAGFAVELRDGAAADAAAAAGEGPHSAASTPDFAVVATQGQGDLAALDHAMRSTAGFVAMVASERKGQALRRTLVERGLESSQVDALQCPAGLAIGAQSPEEVALSVVAQLVQWRRGADGRRLGASSVSEPAAEASVDTPVASGSCCGGAV